MSEPPKENPDSVLSEYMRGVIDRLRQRIAALEQQLAASQAREAVLTDEYERRRQLLLTVSTERDTLQAEVARLRNALTPFSEAIRLHPDMLPHGATIRILTTNIEGHENVELQRGDFERTRDALATPGKGEEKSMDREWPAGEFATNPLDEDGYYTWGCPRCGDIEADDGVLCPDCCDDEGIV
mgnify:CR=1 FL=1